MMSERLLFFNNIMKINESHDEQKEFEEYCKNQIDNLDIVSPYFISVIQRIGGKRMNNKNNKNKSNKSNRSNKNKSNKNRIHSKNSKNSKNSKKYDK
jgi:hypothetical protein